MAFTKVLGPGIHTQANIHSHNINSSGIITATKFVGPITGGGGDFNAGIVTCTTLDVNGNGDISGNLVLGGNLTVNGTTTTLDTNLIGVDRVEVTTAGTNVAVAVTHNGTGDLVRLYDGTSQKVTVDDEGKVGIGTVTPGFQLDVDYNNNAEDGIRILNRANGSTSTSMLRLGNDENINAAFLMLNSSGYGSIGGAHNLVLGHGLGRDVVFATGGVERARITSGGDVGIGTTNPESRLEVSDDGYTVATFNGEHADGPLINIQRQRVNIGFIGSGKHLHSATGNNNALGLRSQAEFTIATGGSTERFRIASNGIIKQTAASGNTIIELNRSDTNTTGAVGVLNFTANDGHSVANIQVRGDGNNEGGAIQFRTTSAAASNDPYASPHNGLIAMQIKSDGQTVLDGSASQSVNYPIQINNSAAAGNGSNPDITAIAFASGASTKASIQAAVYGEGWMSFHNNNNSEKLRIDASGHILPGDAGIQELGSATKEWSYLYFANGKGLKLGSGQVGDLYNDGTDTYFRNSVSNGQTLIRSGGDIWISDYTGNHRAAFRDNSAVDLYFDIENHATAKLSTTATGISVHGEVAATQDYPNYQPALDFNFAKVKKLDSRITYYRTGNASYVDENGIVQLVGDNVPRFNHDPITRESKGLLMEESRTNQITDSYDLTGSDWSPVNLDRESFTTETLAPNGKYEATKIILNTNANQHYTNFSGMTKANGAERQCVSFWAKISSSNYPILKSYITGANAFTNYSEARFNLSTGVVDGTSGSGGFTNHSVKMTKYPNGWYKCEYEATLNSSETTKRFQLLANNGSGVAGNGTDGYYIWGVQVEVGNFATSHIPTANLNPTIFTTGTRGEDVAIMDGTEFTDVFNDTEGTSIVHAHMPNSSGASGLPAYTFKNSSNGNITLGLSRDNNGSPAYHYYNDGSNSGFSRSSANNQNMYKGAMSFKTSDFDSYVNGSANTNTTTFTMPTIDNLRIGGTGGANQVGGHIARFMYYPVKLTNNQLITLTS